MKSALNVLREVLLIGAAMCSAVFFFSLLSLVDETDTLPWLFLLVIVIPSVAAAAIFGFRGHVFRGMGERFVAYAGVFYLAWWIYISIPVARFPLSGNRRCEMAFHQGLTGRCILFYYENQKCVGTVKLHSDLLNHPIAVFPGPDGQSAIFLSYLDTSEAAFTADFAKFDPTDAAIPKELLTPGEPAVERSDFKIRACTQKEVDFVKHTIQTAEPTVLSHLVRWGTGTPDNRQSLLRLVAWATEHRLSDDPILKYANPKLPPED